MRRLLDVSMELIPGKEMGLVDAALSGYPYRHAGEDNALAGLAEFETLLRNELVRLRAVRRKIDPSAHIRADGGFDSEAHIAAMNAVRNPSPLESEKILDAARWDRLDSLAAGHFFDVDALIVYTLKLSILEKWDRIDRTQRQRELESALA
jgi:hypothetical protein